MRWFLVSLAFAGCASAGKGNSIIGGLNDAGPGSNDIPQPDASPIDAPPGEITLSQTASGAITPGNAFGCVDPVTRITAENSYYRVFTLADHAITGTLHITQVEFGIQTATAGGEAVAQPAQLKLGTYGVLPSGPTLELAQVRPLASVEIQIPDGENTRMAVPITADVPATTSVIVELAIPDGTAAGHRFFIGSNTGGERRPGYNRGPECGFDSPTTMKSIADENGFGEVDIVMSVTGTL
jgi:hypothetical protein